METLSVSVEKVFTEFSELKNPRTLQWEIFGLEQHRCLVQCIAALPVPSGNPPKLGYLKKQGSCVVNGHLQVFPINVAISVLNCNITASFKEKSCLPCG